MTPEGASMPEVVQLWSRCVGGKARSDFARFLSLADIHEAFWVPCVWFAVSFDISDEVRGTLMFFMMFV